MKKMEFPLGLAPRIGELTPCHLTRMVLYY